MANPQVLVVGNRGANHVGAHLMSAAAARGIAAEICDVRSAWSASVVSAKAHWWLLGHRPARLRRFSDDVARAVERCRPQCVIATGLAPLDEAALVRIGRAGVRRLNFLTDDPWNPSHRAAWFLRALPHYDVVFTPRHANIADLQRVVRGRVEFLPFAYAPDQHFPDPPVTDDERCAYAADVAFAGGADQARVDVVCALIRAGLRPALYGGYWERYRATRPFARGFLEPSALRRAVAGARINLCLVRRANRDGHSMRSFEIPAMQGCMVAEQTEDHRAMFGDGEQSVGFFRTSAELVDVVRRLLADPARCAELAARARARVTEVPSTYADRLAAMIEAAA